MTSGQPTNLHSEIVRGGSFAPLFSFLCRSHSFFLSFFFFFFLLLHAFFSFCRSPSHLFLPFLSFFPLLHALFSPFHLSRFLWAHICAHPLVILLSSFSLFLFSFCTLFFSPFHPSRSLWAHICAHPLVILLSSFSLLFSPFLSFFFPFARSFFSFSSFPFPLGAYLRPPVSLRSAAPLSAPSPQAPLII